MGEFTIADTHFYHTNILKYEGRPFIDIISMNETIIQNWNSVVGPDDIVYHVGDVALCGFEKARDIIQRLNGIKVLIAGNHDIRNTVSFWMRCGFQEVYKDIYYVRHNAIMSHRPIKPELLPPDVINIHGHTHSMDTGLDKSIYRCVSVELTGYRPVLLDSVINRYMEVLTK